MEMSGPKRMGTVIEMPEIASTEQAICELCGDLIRTVNGGRRTSSGFVPFERLLDLHMEERHPNVCVLQARGELSQQAA
jgi:hypothetical protein